MNLAFSELRRTVTQLRERSQHLERTDQLLGYAWRCVTETQVSLTYIFQDRGNVLVSRDGKVSRGSYQILDRANALLLEVDGETLLYKEAFVDAAVLILYSDAQQEQLTILVNERLVPDLDVQQYLDATYLQPMRAAAEEQRLAERHAALKEASKKFEKRSLGLVNGQELVVWLDRNRQHDPVG